MPAHSLVCVLIGSHARRSWSVLLISASLALRAQPAASTDSSAPTLLDPFTVSADQTGYQATTSAVATGFNRDVEHTPLMINILTEEFMRDAGIQSYADVAQFMPNTYVVPQPEGLGSTANARGQATSYYTQDGVRYYTEPIVRSGSRVEVIKGPATLFFGRAQPGGIFNFGTRPPSAINSSSLAVTYGTFDKKVVDLGSQGKIDSKARWTYRLDGSLQNNGSFLDHAYDRLKFIRGALSFKALDTLRFNARYEFTDRKQSGSSLTPTVIAPQYYADYKSPRPEQIAYARAAANLGSAPEAQVADFLRSRWKENLVNWILDTRSAYINDPRNPDGLYPVYATGISADVVPQGWSYNAAQKGTYAQKLIYNQGGDALWTPNQHVAIKASYTKYDLKRPRLFIQMADLLADGTMRGSPQVREDQNDSTTISLSALLDYDIWKTHHTTNIGAQWFKDYYRNINGTLYALNAAPGLAKDPRASTAAIQTAGYNPFTDPYVDATLLVQRYP
ncbi:MAG TPA: TonB-dependent receptor plug domain-containing protein, partial [Opitutaceae bacterium]|nr:TonB-dependent receptor plug domain-containing protein [Opitutaceae bacterium]